MEYSAIDFRDKFARFEDHWSPKIIAEMNDDQFKLVKVKGDFVWHNHADTDEAFIVLEGELLIELEDGGVSVSAGEMFVVPKGVKHKPFANEECRVMPVEPRSVVNTCDAGGALTAPGDAWI